MKDFSVNPLPDARPPCRSGVRRLLPLVPRRLRPLLLSGLLLSGTAFVAALQPASAQTVRPAAPPPTRLTLTLVGGSVEVLGRVWTAARKAQPVTTALRVGTGRAVLSGPAGGQLTLGSSSTLRVYNNQPDVQSGRFYSSGKAQLYAFGTHLAAQGQVRLDSSGATQRVAVISGTLRLSPGGRAIIIRAGQQYSFRSGKVTAFRESDPWYLSRFVGEGDAVLQASRGSVLTGLDPSRFRSAEIGQVFASGARLKTGADAWAEVGFSGGGYLRLQADSQLKVLGVEKTSKGREVLLQLESGSAWNVVQKGQGGYQLSTPTVTTAVRGTVFRVDASGVVKVFDGSVSLPSQGDAVVGTGAQREIAGKLGGLRTDALDTFNISLDAERARRTVLEVPQLTQVTDLRLTVTSNPDARVSVRIGGHDYAVSGQNGAFALQQSLPEGRYGLVVRAARPEQTRELNQSLVIDRTPPTVTVTGVTVTGATFTVTGSVSDAFTARPLLRAELGGVTYTLHASGPFSWTLPLGTPPADLNTLNLSATDDAGNRTDALLP
ncbi:FecR domain-containing protein [Deinococcus altitudinis]|uniref:FecR domain-containing protein n=1 Tax=Deinococcus altitudinis TaxID=468914 RepID=UPI003891B2DC